MKLLRYCIVLLAALAASARAQGPEVAFSLVRTAHVEAQEGLVYSGGKLTQKVGINHVAVLVRHGQDRFLFDTGLGRDIAAQYAQDMPWWARPFFRYERPVTPARDQLDAAGIAVPRIILSHTHWDHASGLVDFPQAEAWVTQAERDFDAHPGFPGAFPSQVSPATIHWHVYALQDKPAAGFERSLDLYGDGSAVLLPLPGHTPGAVGLLLTLASGKQYLFCGDTVWSAQALKEARPKSWLASLFVDGDRAATLHAVQQLHDLMQQRPDLVVVPAHDAAVQDTLGYFPQWVR
jgi:glyoxylase-like metal-dependent hydrolase (beta-lactamase superfamily II)